MMNGTNSSLDADITLSAYKLSTYLNMKILIFAVHKMNILQHKIVVNRTFLKVPLCFSFYF